MPILSRFARATRYLTAELGLGLATLLAFLVPGLSNAAAQWRKIDSLRRSSSYLRLGTRPATARSHVPVGWLPLHSLAGLLFGTVTLLPAAVGLSTVWFNATSLSFHRGIGEVHWFYISGWIVEADLGQMHVPGDSWILLFAMLAVSSVALTLLISRPLAYAHARVSVALLTPSAAQLAERVDVLTSSRADALDAHGAELRRIERDLHDGTQAQLVALSMRLGLAEQRLAHDPETATLLREARTGAEDAMTELRDVIRTMYPPILADRGLAGAISGLAARSVVPVRVTVDDLGQLPAPVEAAAYFVVAEAVTNAIKHSGATQILVHLDRDYNGLHVQVTDDGVGGVDETQGTGIVGIQRRVAALDGATTIHSPIGGGTTITVELPCGS